MVRTIPSIRWDYDRVNALSMSPYMEKPTAQDTIEAEANPHLHAESEQPPEGVDPSRAKMRLTIELRDLGKYGFTAGCPKCRVYSQGKKEAAKKEHHSDACRSRVYQAMKEHDEPKVQDGRRPSTS